LPYCLGSSEGDPFAAEQLLPELAWLATALADNPQKP